MSSSVWFGVAVGTVVYVAFIGGIVYLSVRWSRRVLQRKSDAITSTLEASGGRLVGEAEKASLYRGQEREYDLGGQRVFVNSYYVSRNSVRVNLRVASGAYPAVLLYAENTLQRVGKALGLNREVQLGDEAFDQAVYVDTHEKDDAVVKRLLGSDVVRAAVRELIEWGYTVQLSRRGVEAFQIVYALRPADGSRAQDTVATLARLSSDLPRFEADTLAPERRSGHWAVAALLVVPAILGAVGAGVADTGSSRLLDVSSGAQAAMIGGALWVVYVVGLVFVVRGTPRALNVLLLGALFGLFGVPVIGALTALMLNSALDPSPAEQHWVRVEGIRSRKSHELSVASWRAPSGVETVAAPSSIFKTIQAGEEVEVRVHPGRFGWAWVEPVTEHRPAVH